MQLIRSPEKCINRPRCQAGGGGLRCCARRAAVWQLGRLMHQLKQRTTQPLYPGCCGRSEVQQPRMALARLQQFAEQLRAQLEAVPPAQEVAESVLLSCDAKEATEVVLEVVRLQRAEPLTAADVERLNR